ncbi:tachykinin-3 [Bombina bombina]|uniref:tachykinin-3 n=1 Tax=Bombina bombina TaxID=8345 RepID=UPI00235AA726|nr:tachykinin-3 [Bombina bombina]
MVNKLEQRGYGRKLIKKVHTELVQQDQKSLLLPQGVKKNVEDVSDNINFITTFNPISKILSESVKKNWEIKSSDIYKLPASILKRFYNEDSYDGFVGLMGRRNTDPKEFSSLPLKRDMHDFFVGLMGKRNLQTGNPTDEGKDSKPDTRYSTKCRMRYRRSL